MARPTDIVLHPGEYFVGDHRHRIRTLLGSCVSMTLWHPQRRIGAMSHFLLSCRGEPLSSSSLAPSATMGLGLDARYGEEAMLLMLAALRRRDIDPRQCQGKVFGGGNMFPQLARADSLKVGLKNGEAARALLRRHGIPLVAGSLFGAGHRSIIFDVGSGDVWTHQASPGVPGTPNRKESA